MKIKFKQQPFQLDAVRSVVDCFNGQPALQSRYTLNEGRRQKPVQTELAWTGGGSALEEHGADLGYGNSPIQLLPHQVLDNVQAVQKERGLRRSERLEGHYNLTVEMETGTGKTYTYIRTMFELHKRYGWGKYIVVVPSIAIREGVLKSFQLTEEHFMAEYGMKARCFIYNSRQLHQIERFAGDAGINVMIINAQAFAAKGQDARRIYMELDDFNSRKPIDVLAGTNPILIIDEPQSVEGKKTKEALELFRPLFTIRYSATHKEEYNKVYRLDALDAYNLKLVKKITVKGITTKGGGGQSAYLYAEGIDVSDVRAPVARLEYEVKRRSGLGRKTSVVRAGDDLYRLSGELEQYRGYKIAEISGITNSLTFVNGLTLYAGDAQGDVAELQLRRIQIRETILSHLQKERQQFRQGIKVLSLFFIDEVAKYRAYDEAGQERSGLYAELFEEEYAEAVLALLEELDEREPYAAYLQGIAAGATHKGYFSIDKRSSRLVDPKGSSGAASGRESDSDDADAYDLIMRDKERLLGLAEPTRFLFSHSALKEGWDNPNVFQICTLKHSDSAVKKRQEVGRGLRLCVNQEGERIDASMPGVQVHDINVLTVVASESYEQFAKQLQMEIAETLSDRPRKADRDYFLGKVLHNAAGERLTLDDGLVSRLHFSMIKNGYVDADFALTDDYVQAAEAGSVALPPELQSYREPLLALIERIYIADRTSFAGNERERNVTTVRVNENYSKKEFQELWRRINRKSFYTVDFDSAELVRKCVDVLDRELRVPELRIVVKLGELERIQSAEQLREGSAFTARESAVAYREADAAPPTSQVKLDLIGKLMGETRLTRRTIVDILAGVKETTFRLYRRNPEEFIVRAGRLINGQKAAAVIEKLTYSLQDETYDADLFTRNAVGGRLGKDAIPTVKHIYDYLVSDSGVERRLAGELDISSEVKVYAKLPSGFAIPTPFGNYNPDWAIAFDEGKVRHIYFVAETKGSLDSAQLREVERAKIECARKHFAMLSSLDVRYEVADSYDKLMEIVR